MFDLDLFANCEICYKFWSICVRSLDPHNQRAMEGLQRLHSSSSFGSRSSPSETSYYNNMSDVNPPDSDHEGNSEISVD